MARSGQVLLLLLGLASLAYGFRSCIEYLRCIALAIHPPELELDIYWITVGSVMLWFRHQVIRQGRFRNLALFLILFLAIAGLTKRAMGAVQAWAFDWTIWGDESLSSAPVNQIAGYADLSPLLLAIPAIVAASTICFRAHILPAENLQRWKGKFQWPIAIIGGLLLAWIGSMQLRFLWDDLTMWMPESWDEAWPGVVVADIVSLLTSPVTLALTFAVWMRTLSARMVAKGVAISLLGDSVTVLFARWDRIKWIRLTTRPEGTQSLVIAYAGKFGLPMTIAVGEDSYQEGAAMVDSILREADDRGITVHRTTARRGLRTAGTIFILGGGVLTIVSYLATNAAWRPLIYDHEYSFERFREAAAIFPLTALSVGTVASISIGLGLLSAHHRGGPAWPALWLWAWFSQNVSTPILDWLVWHAVFAIHTAMPSTVLPPQPVATGPSQQEWMLGSEAIRALPLFAIAFYFVGIALGRRRKSPPIRSTLASAT